jgi:hypothetical protein
MIARHVFKLLTTAFAAASCFGSASAQQVTGVLGSPGATTTISGQQLPPPDSKFVALLEYRHDVPFKFTGTINKLTFNFGAQHLTAEEHEQMRRTVAGARD